MLKPSFTSAGDERTLPDGKPTVEAAMPAFLRRRCPQGRADRTPAYRPTPPNSKPFIQAAKKAKRGQTLANAKAAHDAAQNALAAAEAALAGVATDHPGEREKLNPVSRTHRKAPRQRSRQRKVPSRR
jgi:hypothetical protein